MEGRYIVLVTGGSGCLGQHLIKLLQTRADHVDVIRVLDVVEFVKKLDYEDRVPVTSFCEDISDLTNTTAFQGVTIVFHLASVISVSNFPDIAAMERVNVRGTEEVLEVCIKEGVERLVYCSTVDVVCGYNDIVDGTEDTTSPPDKLIYEGYGGTKLKAERTVLASNGKKSQSGAVFQTVSLRPTVFYGELDPYYIPTVLQRARSNGGVFVQLGDGTAQYQHSYVGNIAWAFICADQTLRKVSSSSSGNSGIGGEVFYITDDGPACGMSEQVKPFLDAAGCRLSSYKLPFYPMYGSVLFAQGLLWLLSPLKKVDLGFSAMSLRYINTSYTYSSAKARRLLGYAPIFTPEDSIDQSNKYYLGLSSE